MKKIALVLAVLLVLSGAAFAEVVGGDPTVSGYVSTTIGYDLEGAFWGIDGSNSITLTIPLASGSDGASGDDDLYGEISLTDVAISIDGDDWDEDNTTGTITAKIVAGDIFVGLNTGDFNFNNAEGTKALDVNLSDDWYAPYGDGNYQLGFDNGSIMAAVKFAAKGGITRAAAATAEVPFADAWTGYTAEEDATDADQNTGNGFVLGADFSITSDAFSMPVAATLDVDYASELLFGVTAAPSIAAGPVTLDIPVDVVMIGSVFGLDLAPELAFAVMDGLDLGVNAYVYMVDPTNYVDLGATIGIGMVDNLTAEIGVTLSDLTGTLGYDVYLDAAYVLADGLTLSLVPGYDGGFYMEAGLEMAAAFTGIDNTTISLNYTDGYFASDAADQDLGIVSLCTKIAF